MLDFDVITCIIYNISQAMEGVTQHGNIIRIHRQRLSESRRKRARNFGRSVTTNPPAQPVELSKKMNNKLIAVESFRAERINFAKAIKWEEQVTRLQNASIKELHQLARQSQKPTVGGWY